MIDWKEYLVGFLLCAGALMMMGGLTILSLQALDYMDTGQWTPRPLRLILGGSPENIHNGLDVVIHWLLDLPQSGVLIAVGFFLIVLHIPFYLIWPDGD